MQIIGFGLWAMALIVIVAGLALSAVDEGEPISQRLDSRTLGHIHPRKAGLLPRDETRRLNQTL